MRTRQFEGASLEEAVAAARAELGADARILSANRVRQGGLGGFFAKERIEVVAEPGISVTADPPAEAWVPPATAAPADAEAWQPDADIRDADGTGVTDGLDDLLEDMLSAPPTSVLEMAEAVSEREAELAESRPPATEHWSHAAPASTVGDPWSAVAPRPVTSTFDTGADDPAPPSPVETPVVAGAAEGTPVPDEPAGPGVVGATVTASTGSVDGDGRLAEQRRRRWRAAEPPTSPTGSVGFAAVLEEIAKGAGVSLSDYGMNGYGSDTNGRGAGRPPEETPAPPTAAERAGYVVARRPAAIDVGPGRRLLDRLGVPAAYLEGLSGDDEPFELLRRALQRLPTCPPKPTGPGGVMVIVGERIWADDVAVGICRELSLRPEDIVVATQRRGRRGTQAFIDTAETAGYERRSWRWRKVPTVVIVESSVAPAGDPWATEVLTALEPTLCWGVAEASRKAEDVGEWSRRLGGFDALALVDLESTLSPAAALAIGLPISEIDGLVADADAWVHALAATVQAAGMWP